MPRVTPAGAVLSAQPRCSQASSSSSTLSLLFGKRSFSSGLVMSGLSAAEGGNSSDTQSSSSVNIITLGPSARHTQTQVQLHTRVNEHNCEQCDCDLSKFYSHLHHNVCFIFYIVAGNKKYRYYCLKGWKLLL